MYEKTTVKNVR